MRVETAVTNMFFVQPIPFLLLFGTAFARSFSPVVYTTTGPIRGTTTKTSHLETDAYLGIPYAMPPVGELRFRRPVPISPWTHVYDATEKPPPCQQFLPEKRFYAEDTENMTEDCLYLNVWVPKTVAKDKDRKAVMVWLHGGSFFIGSSGFEMYDGAILASYGDVIVASVNFRLGTLGFFYANADGAKGNMALYDQVLALKWIKENAEAFGGDGNRITLFGQSSGASSISGHLLSPLSQDLFSRAIMQSGGALHPLFFESKKQQMKMSNSIAVAARCANRKVNLTTDPEKVMRCMRALPSANITEAQALVQMSQPALIIPIHGDEFLPEETSKLAREHPRNKDILIGINENEGPFFVVELLRDYLGKDGHGGMANFGRFFVRSLLANVFVTIGEEKGKKIANHYIENSENDLRKAVCDAVGDYAVTCGALFFADLYSRNKNNTYFYKYSHRPELSPTAEWMGATHGLEIPFVFGQTFSGNYNVSKEEQLLSMRIMQRWTSFAKTGNPNVEGELRWPHYSYDYPAYLDIDVEEKIKLHPHGDRCEFWRDRFRASMKDTTTAPDLLDF